MKTCIICRQLLDEIEFNDEHVIPDSLGGYYHIDKICTKCNSELGAKVDTKLINNILSIGCRESLGLKGKSGKLPHFLEGVFTLSNDPSQKVKVVYENGKPILKMIPKIIDTPTGYSVTLDGREINKIHQIREKKNQKLGKKIQTIMEKRELIQPELTGQIEFNLHEFKMGLLKIAYEFTIDELPTYFEDEMSIQISKVLNNRDFKFQNISFMNSGLMDKKDLVAFEIFLEIKEMSKHYIILYQSPFQKKELYCIVNLFDIYFLTIKMSDKTYLKDSELIIGVNNIRNKTYKRYRDNELIFAIIESGDKGIKL